MVKPPFLLVNPLFSMLKEHHFSVHFYSSQAPKLGPKLLVFFGGEFSGGDPHADQEATGASGVHDPFGRGWPLACLGCLGCLGSVTWDLDVEMP